MTTDILRDAGYLTLGSRLKRLGEKLQAETQAILSRKGLAPPAAQQPVLLALYRHGPLRIGALADALGQSQPGVTRMANALTNAGLVEPEIGGCDKRVRTLRLSPAGRRFVEAAKADAWRVVEAAVREACAGLDGSLLDQIEALEAALDARALPERAETLEEVAR